MGGAYSRVIDVRMRQPSQPHCLVLIGTLVSGYLVSANEPGPRPANEKSPDQLTPSIGQQLQNKQSSKLAYLTFQSMAKIKNNVLQQPFKNPPRIDKSMMLKYVKI